MKKQGPSIDLVGGASRSLPLLFPLHISLHRTSRALSARRSVHFFLPPQKCTCILLQ